MFFLFVSKIFLKFAFNFNMCHISLRKTIEKIHNAGFGVKWFAQNLIFTFVERVIYGQYTYM